MTTNNDLFLFIESRTAYCTNRKNSFSITNLHLPKALAVIYSVKGQIQWLKKKIKTPELNSLFG
jgi:hypothetical protein